MYAYLSLSFTTVSLLLFLSFFVTEYKVYVSSLHSTKEDLKHSYYTYYVQPESKPYTGGAIIYGAGYSSDSQQVTEQPCFNASIASISDREASVSLEETVSFSNLQKLLGIDVSVDVGYGKFSAGAKADYLRSLEEKDYSLSLNYYTSVSEKATVKINGHGLNALTQFGQDSYSYNHSIFRLVCGDHYISSYRRGAFLIAGINIVLNSHEEKNEFRAKAGAKYGNIFNAAANIRYVCEKNKISAKVKIHAFQIGGEPSHLTNILSSSIVECSINEIDKCITTAKKLLDYAKDFGKQIENHEVFDALGTADYRPIERIGLDSSLSWVTPKVENYRRELSTNLKENQYYIEKLHSFYNGYPVKLDNVFFENANVILTKANDNIRTLMDSLTGAIGCYNEPENCEKIKAKIDDKLENITNSDLKFLENMKCTIPLYDDLGISYNTGGTEWLTLLRKNSTTLRYASISDVKYWYWLYDDLNMCTYNGTWDSRVPGYVGTYKTASENMEDVYIIKEWSSFYFEDFKTAENKTIKKRTPYCL